MRFPDFVSATPVPTARVAITVRLKAGLLARVRADSLSR